MKKTIDLGKFAYSSNRITIDIELREGNGKILKLESVIQNESNSK